MTRSARRQPCQYREANNTPFPDIVWNVVSPRKLDKPYGKQYSTQEEALEACVMDKTCTGVNFDGLLYQMCKGTTRSVAVGYTCFTKGGQLHTYKGYTWDERKNCAISSDYYDGVTYRGISQAMVRCAGSHDCNGINYDGGNSFRLMTGYTPTTKAGSTCYIQGSEFQ